MMKGATRAGLIPSSVVPPPSVEKGPGACKQSCQGKAASEVGWAHTLLPTAAAKTGLESDITLPAEDLAVMGPGKQQSQ